MNIRQILLLFLLSVSFAHADQVMLNNGDHLSGKVIRMDAGKLIVKPVWSAQITIPWVSVAQIRLDTPTRIVLPTGLVKGTVEPDGTVGMKIAAGSAYIDGLRRRDILAINPAIYTDPEDFKRSGRIDAGLGWARGNTDTDSYYFSGQMKWENRLNRFTFQGDVRNVSSGGTILADRSRIATKYDRFVNPRSYLYAQGIAEQEKFANIQLRTTGGVGFGYQIYRREYLNLGVESGFSVVQTRFINAPGTTESTLRVAVNYDQYFWNQSFKVENSSEVFFPIAGFNDLLVRSKTSLLVPVGKNITAGLALIVDLDRQPATRKNPLNRSLQATAGYGF